MNCNAIKLLKLSMPNGMREARLLAHDQLEKQSAYDSHMTGTAGAPIITESAAIKIRCAAPKVVTTGLGTEEIINPALSILNLQESLEHTRNL